jgi:hypothetical protein
MSYLYLPPCPTTCSGSVADVDFDNCTPVYHWGEISKVYIGSTNVPNFADVSSIVEWNSILDDSADDHIRELTVIGEQTEAETVEVPTSGDRIAIGFKKFSINFEIDETNDINYVFHQMLECGGKFKIWYETSDGILYGGNEGIEASVKTNQVIPKERTALVKIVGKATWNSLHSPVRCVSPMY